MNCLECQDILQHRLDGEPNAPNAALDHHLAQCAPCRERHAAARRLLDGLQAFPRPTLPAAFAGRVIAAVVRDRERRRARVRRSLYVTAALAASILFMLLIAYFRAPDPDGKPDPGPIVHDATPRQDIVPPPVEDNNKQPEKKDERKHEQGDTLASLSERLADKTLDRARAMWTAANPVEGLPVGELPDVANVKELEPAAEPLRQAKQDASDSLNAVTHSARRAFDYFARELPMLDMPPTVESK
jgi:hypothetical protein